METGEGHLEGPIRFTCESTPVLILILVAFLCLVASCCVFPLPVRRATKPEFRVFFSVPFWGLSRISRARPATENREKNPEARRTQLLQRKRRRKAHAAIERAPPEKPKHQLKKIGKFLEEVSWSAVAIALQRGEHFGCRVWQLRREVHGPYPYRIRIKGCAASTTQGIR